MKPTEHEGTVAVAAAAQTLYRDTTVDLPTAPSWDGLGPHDRRPWLEAVLPTVWAALEALPDRGAHALRETAHEVRLSPKTREGRTFPGETWAAYLDTRAAAREGL